MFRKKLIKITGSTHIHYLPKQLTLKTSVQNSGKAFHVCSRSRIRFSRSIWFGADYMTNFSPGRNFSSASRRKLLEQTFAIT